MRRGGSRHAGSPLLAALVADGRLDRRTTEGLTVEMRFRAGDMPDGSFTEVGRWQLQHLGELRSLRTALRSSVPLAPPDGARAGQNGRAGSAAAPSGTGLEAVPDRLLLVANELASNALKHSDGGAVVVLSQGEEGWLVDVIDGAVDAEPTPAMDRSPGDGGYGLYLVAEVATAVGWYAGGDRKHVWGQVAPVSG